MRRRKFFVARLASWIRLRVLRTRRHLPPVVTDQKVAQILRRDRSADGLLDDVANHAGGSNLAAQRRVMKGREHRRFGLDREVGFATPTARLRGQCHGPTSIVLR
jgi:hypothetical protein